MRVWLALSPIARAGSLDAWGLALPEGDVAVMPFAQSGPGGTFLQLGAGLGLGGASDVNVLAGSTVGPDGAQRPLVEVLPRVFVHHTLGLALHLAFTPGGATGLGAEVHGEWAAVPVSLGVNAGVQPPLGAGPLALWGIVAPELHAGPGSVFLEVDPVLGQGVTLVPGVALAFGDAAAHQVSVGFPAPPGGPAGVGVSWTSTAARRAPP